MLPRNSKEGFLRAVCESIGFCSVDMNVNEARAHVFAACINGYITFDYVARYGYYLAVFYIYVFLFFFSVKAGTDALVWEWALVCAVNSLLMDTDVVSFFLTKLL